MSKGTNRNLHARNTLEQLLALYTDPDSHNAQRHRQTDGRTDRRTDNRLLPIAELLIYVAVRSAKNDLVTWFKILKGMTSITSSNFLTLSGGCTRGAFSCCPDSRVNIRAQFLATRVIDVWNSLPPHIITADSVASFVKGILNSLNARFLVPDFYHSYCYGRL